MTCRSHVDLLYVFVCVFSVRGRRITLTGFRLWTLTQRQPSRLTFKRSESYELSPTLRCCICSFHPVYYLCVCLLKVTHNLENVLDLQSLEENESVSQDKDTLLRHMTLNLKRLVDERDQQAEVPHINTTQHMFSD